MKANEALDKLYLLPNGLISYCRNTDEDIEYACADAFIEKACEWLKKNADDYTWYDETERESGMIDEFVDVFKNYMKEE